LADNLQLNEPTTAGAIIATDDIGGVQHQLMKMEFGDPDSATQVSPTNPLPVTNSTLPTNAAKESGGNLDAIAAKDFATQATLALVKAKTDNLDIAISAFRDALRGVSNKTLTDLDSDLGTLHTDLGLLLTQSDFDTKTGSLTETAPATDIASSGLNGRLQRIAQRITSLIALLPTALDGSGFLKVHEQGTAATTVVDGGNVAAGAIADAIVAAGAAGTLSAKLRRVTQGLEDLKTTIVLAAGANIIGKVGIDQTTPGTTNGVVVKSTQDASATGTISAADVVAALPAEDGVFVTGVPTANSAVFCAAPGGDSAFTIQLTGTFSGKYWFESSYDSTNGTDGKWILVKAKQQGHVQEFLRWSTTAEGAYRGNLAGAKYVRVRNTGGTSSWSTTVLITMSAGVGAIFQSAPTPEGDKKIGRVSIAEIFPPNKEQLAIEGYPIIGAMQQLVYGTEISVGGAAMTGTIKFGDLGAGKASWVEEIITTSGGGCMLNLAHVLNNGSFTMQPATETLYGDIPFEGGTITHKIQRPFLEGSNIVISALCSETGRRPRITVQVRGTSFTDDFNFDAKTLAIMIGTSCDGDNMGIDPATGIRYRNEWLHMYRMRDSMLDAGKNVRIINKAVVASESDLWVKQITSGCFGGTNYDLLIVNLGINDGITGSGISTTQFETNLKKIITHRNRYRPEASVLFMTPTPTDTAIRSGMAAYRTSVANVANDATLGTTARKVYLCDVFAAWVTATGQATGLNPTATADLNFNDAERSAGNRIHPSGAGMTITGNALFATVQTTHFYKNLA
jgi:lysophospholipase L1-like esterase